MPVGNTVYKTLATIAKDVQIIFNLINYKHEKT